MKLVDIILTSPIMKISNVCSKVGEDPKKYHVATARETINKIIVANLASLRSLKADHNNLKKKFQCFS